MKLHAIVLFLLCLFPFTLHAQLINMESARMQSDTTGWKGDASASFALSKNTIQVFSANVDAHMQYKSKRSLYLIKGSYGFLKGAGQKLIDYGFLHLRYNYKIDKMIRWEVFTQLQQNVVTGIKSRYLLGSGPRFKLLERNFIKIYAGTLMMYEREKSTVNSIPIENNVRLSSYLSFTIIPNNIVELISTTYFQPLLDDWADRRVLNQAVLKIKAGKRLGIRIDWDYLNDSRPVIGKPSENYRLGMGFSYEL